MPGTDKQPIKMLNDRVLVQIPQAEGERRSRSGILIPATAEVGKRLAWALPLAPAIIRRPPLARSRTSVRGWLRLAAAQR